MTRGEFDDTFSLYQLSELIEQSSSKRKVRELLQTFPCTRNLDLQDFLHKKALIFEKHLRSRTYLYIDNETKTVAAYFTVAISTLHTDGISREVIKMLDGYQDDTKSIPCFLIGQLGKSDQYQATKIGEYILEDAIETIDDLHYAVGGRFILLDAVNIPKVIEFYQDSLFFPIEETSYDKEASLSRRILWTIYDYTIGFLFPRKQNLKPESIKMIRPYFEELEQ
ncbi:MAG: hypothetical protein AB7V28_12030 [Arcobacteraceae bacterium]|jgi:hypothetical protein